MSQHNFNAQLSNGIRVRVRCGWDRPLQYLFLDVETICAKEEDERTVYSNLMETNPALTVEQVGQRLATLQIAVPAGLLDQLREDQRQNMGNSTRNW